MPRGAPAQGVNDPRIVDFRISTSDATPTPIVDREIPGGSAIGIQIFVTARENPAGTPNRAFYARLALVYRAPAGVAQMQGGVQAATTRESNANWDCTIDVSGNNFRVMVTGDLGADINWHCRMEAVRAN